MPYWFETEATETGFVKWPKIRYLKDIASQIYHDVRVQGKDEDDNWVFDRNKPMPKIEFLGTVKLHGTNAAINWHKEKGFRYQSRNGFKTEGHQGFVEHMKAKEAELKPGLSLFAAEHGATQIVVFGEWCGEGIQKKVGISQLPKRFVPFPYMWTDSEGFLPYIAPCFDPITLYARKTLILDFDDMAGFKAKVKDLVDEVEKECPAAKWYGINNGVGEGLVFYAELNGKMYAFKAKGDEHKKVPPKPVIDLSAEQTAAGEFVGQRLLSDRMQQGLDYLKERDFANSLESTGEFIQYVVKDFFDEEATAIAENKLHEASLRRCASQMAAMWFKNQL